MLRRYLITNLISTIALYGAALALVPSAYGFFDALRLGFELYAMDHSWLGPILTGIPAVTGG
ncbi:MAG: hypothetical protein ACKVP4_03895 [Hyphomicrobium sp.]